MSISKDERVLIVLNQVASGDTDHLYNFIEGAGRLAVQSVLADAYAKIDKLYDSKATLRKLVASLRTHGAKATVKRIDVFVMLHGRPGELVFADRVELMSHVRDEIAALNLGAKLRLLYNTSCYGDSHSAGFIAAGFDSAIGSKEVNANAAIEFTPFIKLWELGFKLSDCLAPSVPLTRASDAAATAFGQLTNASWKNDVNSTKVIRGNKNLKITT